MSRSPPPPAEPRRRTSSIHYHTFPTQPPASQGSPSPSTPHGPSRASSGLHGESLLPKKQLVVLAIIALAEQTALNSISPYLPDMARSFPEVKKGQEGLYVGIIASAFALAQFATNFFWGWASDKMGRKPVILLGTLLTLACFLAFGFCRTLWQAILVQALMGFVNGNQGVVSTCLGEITDRSNQSRAFTYLPVVYGIGSITGPIVGGLLVFKRNPFDSSKLNSYPYLLPNLFSAGILAIDLVVCMAFLDESLKEARDLPPLGKRIESVFVWLWQFSSSTRPTYIRRLMAKRRSEHTHAEGGDGTAEDAASGDADSDAASTVMQAIFPHTNTEHLTKKEIFNRDTVLLLVTYFIFQLSNISYNSLYPIFAAAQTPIGRELSPEEIGLSLAFAGVVTIVFQVSIYSRVRDRCGNKTTYRLSLVAFVLAFLLMPWVGYKDSGPALGSAKGWLWAELGAVLIIKTVAAVGGLTSALLLITNSAPNCAVLGTLNGLAQTLSAAGRAVGPFISGALFSAATNVQPKGEALAFGVFGGVSFVGFVASLGIRGKGLEAEGSGGDDSGNVEDANTYDAAGERSGENEPLLASPSPGARREASD